MQPQRPASANALHHRQEVTDPAARSALAALAAWVSIVGNLFLAAVKLLLGFMFNSISIMADGVHTASDVLTSVVVLIGFRAAAKPPDESHPFGHGRAESVAALVIAVLLGVTALKLVTDAVTRLFSPPEIHPSWTVIGLMLVFALVKEWMARFAARIGRRIDSEAVHADAWHHRSDAITTGLVVIALVAVRFGLARLDAVFGLAVAGLVGYVAFQLTTSAANTLLGKAAPRAVKDEIRRLARTVPGVLGVHEVTVHQYGRRSVINLHVETAGDMPVRDAHDVATRVERHIAQNLSASVVVHLEPAPPENLPESKIPGFFC